MPSSIHLSDPDNRDDQGSSFEFTGDIGRVVAYLDGAIRSDVTENGLKTLEKTLTALRAGDFPESKRLARRIGIYLTDDGAALAEGGGSA